MEVFVLIGIILFIIFGMGLSFQKDLDDMEKEDPKLRQFYKDKYNI